jgi:alginate O-acetyltransferase complex protein AlgI
VLVFSLVLALVGIIEATGLGNAAKFRVYHQHVSSDGEKLSRDKWTDAEGPITLRADADESLAIELYSNGTHLGGVLNIVGRDGKAALGLSDRKDLFAGAPNCVSIGATGWKCKVLWPANVAKQKRLILYPADEAVNVQSIAFTPVSVLRVPATTFAGLLMFFCILLLLAPAIVWSRRIFPGLELPILVSLSALWIASTGMISALTIASFLVAGYFLVMLELKRASERSSGLLVVVGFVALALFYFKVLAPYGQAAFGQTTSLAAPLGLSYFGVRLIDVIFAARAKTVKELSPIEFLGFMLHPSMIAAGPITTLGEFRRARIQEWSIVDYASGVARCSLGLAKKLCADLLLAPVVLKSAGAISLHPESAHASIVWPMLLGQIMYIYLDFTGYTDLALGTGRALGWRLPENFNLPLLRTNLQRYWQSWHMTLSNWVMRRVYFPAYLESRSPIFSAVCAMLAIGVWHQPNFGWAAWALHHGLGLGVTIKFLQGAFSKQSLLTRINETTPGRIVISVTGWAITMAWVALGLSYTLFDNYSMSFLAIRGAFRF